MKISKQGLYTLVNFLSKKLATPSTPKTGAESEHQQANSTTSADHAAAGYERMVKNTHSELNALGNIIDQRSDLAK